MFNKVSSIFVLIVGIVIVAGCAHVQEQIPEQEVLDDQEVVQDYGVLYISLNEEFTLYENQSVIIENDNYEIKITEFFNSPCPADVECYWSGVGIAFEYIYNGEVVTGVNLTQAFDYQTVIIDTDYETYAKLKIVKME